MPNSIPTVPNMKHHKSAAGSAIADIVGLLGGGLAGAEIGKRIGPTVGQTLSPPPGVKIQPGSPQDAAIRSQLGSTMGEPVGMALGGLGGLALSRSLQGLFGNKDEEDPERDETQVKKAELGSDAKPMSHASVQLANLLGLGGPALYQGAKGNSISEGLKGLGWQALGFAPGALLGSHAGNSMFGRDAGPGIAAAIGGRIGGGLTSALGTYLYNRGLEKRDGDAEPKGPTPANETSAALAGVLSPFSAGLYTGAKADSTEEGTKATLRSLLGTLGGTAVGAGLGAGIGHLSGSGQHPEEAQARLILGTLLGGGAGMLTGSALGGRHAARKYNETLKTASHWAVALGGTVKEAGRLRSAGGFMQGATNLVKGLRHGLKGGRRAQQAVNKALPIASAPSMIPGRQTRALGRASTAQQKFVAAGPRGEGNAGAAGRFIGDKLSGGPVKWLTGRRVIAPAAFGWGHQTGHSQGTEAGVAQTLNYFENMPWWQSMAYGIPNVFGVKGMMNDYGLDQAAKKPQTWLEKLYGPDYNDVKEQLTMLRPQTPNAPTVPAIP